MMSLWIASTEMALLWIAVVLCVIVVLAVGVCYVRAHSKSGTRGRVCTVSALASPLLAMSATALAREIRSCRVSSVQVVTAFIDQIRLTTPALNAVVASRFVEALREAADADARLAAAASLASLPPFHGVPISIKECFAVTGMPHTSGLVARVGKPATADACAVARLRAAGFIVLGVTNISELCMWYESSNVVYGRTSNPYCVERVVGGSSGGDAANVSACGAPCGLGSDIGGSIRMPAFFCGIYGHKPTGGAVPGTGQFPMAEGDGCRHLATGPLCRFAEDLWPMLMVLAGPDGVDVGATPGIAARLRAREASPADVDMRRVTVYRVERLCAPALTAPVDPELLAAEARASEALCGRAGCTAAVLQLPEFADALNMWSAMLSLAVETTFRDNLESGGRVFMPLELVKWALGLSDHTLPALGLALVERWSIKCAPAATRAFAAKCVALRARLDAALGDHGVLLFPSHTSIAPPHNVPLFRGPNFAYTCFFNALHVPVTQCPTGMSALGLPMGVQVVGARGRDVVTIAVAQRLEALIGGWVPPAAAAAAPTTGASAPPRDSRSC